MTSETISPSNMPEVDAVWQDFAPNSRRQDSGPLRHPDGFGSAAEAVASIWPSNSRSMQHQNDINPASSASSRSDYGAVEINRGPGNMAANMATSTSSVMSSDLDGSAANGCFSNHASELDLTTQKVLQDGLGLVLHEGLSTPLADLPMNDSTAPGHNWQSNKHSVKSRLLYLLNTGVLSDVTFLVGGSSLLMSTSSSALATPERFAAHKFVLSMSSAVFDAMFNGQMAVNEDKAIEIPDVEPKAFKALLTFLYTDEIIVESETVMSVLYAAKKYAVPALEQECVEFLKDNISSENAFLLLTQARLFDETVLAEMCLDAIDKNTVEALSSDGFTEIDLDTLCSVLSRDSLGLYCTAL